MIEVLHSESLWARVGRLSKGGRVTVLVAYANRDHLKLKAGDTLVCDASDGRIATGATTHKLLLALAKRGVVLLHCERLHAKVVRLPGYVMIGSANMTANAEKQHEISLLTDDPQAISQVDEHIESLRGRFKPITPAFLQRIKDIEPFPRGGTSDHADEFRPSVTWLMGYRELSEKEQQKTDEGLQRQPGMDVEVPEWFRVPEAHAMAKPIHVRDSLVLIDLDTRRASKPVMVTGVLPVGKHVVYLHSDTPEGGVSWERMKAKLIGLGIRIGSGVPKQMRVAPEVDAKLRAMYRSAKSQ